MSAPVDVLAVLRRLCANVEFASLKSEGGEAIAAIGGLISALQQSDEWIRQARREVPYSADATLQRNIAALRAVGGAE